MKISEITIRQSMIIISETEWRRGSEECWLQGLLTLSLPGDCCVSLMTALNPGHTGSFSHCNTRHCTQELVEKLLLSESHQHLHNFHSCIRSPHYQGSTESTKADACGSEQNSFPALSAGSHSLLENALTWLWFSFHCLVTTINSEFYSTPCSFSHPPIQSQFFWNHWII